MTEQITLIPLSKLVPSAHNVRHTGAAEGLAELMASIEAHGLIQNLAVRRAQNGKGKPGTSFEVVAGGRRLAALKQLADQKKIAKNLPVPCRILNGDNVLEASLAENVVRAPLHPADQYEAFAALHRNGRGAEEIAARFGVTATVVQQRLKLAAVSPRLMEEYRSGEMTLEELMAFTVTDDHEAQERVWFESPQHDRQPHTIRRALTRSHIAGDDRRARFVGIAAFEAAGGIVLRDLFDPEGGGYFTDSVLLDRLVAEKLSAEAEQLRNDGWAWVEVFPQMDYASLGRMARIYPEPEPLTAEVQARLDELTVAYDHLVAEHGDEPQEEAAKEIERLSVEIDTLSDPKLCWSPEDKGRSGVMLALGSTGVLRMELGLIRPEDRKPDPATDAAVTTEESGRAAASEAEAEAEPQERISHSDALLEDLSAHRTAALREALAAKPAVALTALTHVLVLRTFFGSGHRACVDLNPVVVDLRRCSTGIGGTPASAAMAERHRRLSEQLPAESALWEWIGAQDLDTILKFLAYCVSTTVNALRLRNEHGLEERLAQADLLAIATGLDMAAWWQPTRDNYLSRVAKHQILRAVTEAVSPQAAENIAPMKKDGMAARAEELLQNTRWLPEPLRLPSTASVRNA